MIQLASEAHLGTKDAYFRMQRGDFCTISLSGSFQVSDCMHGASVPFPAGAKLLLRKRHQIAKPGVFVVDVRCRLQTYKPS